MGDEILKQLRKAGIPAHFGDNTAFLSDPPFTIVADIIRLYINHQDLMALNGILANALAWSKKEIKTFLGSLHRVEEDWMNLSSSVIKTNLKQGWDQWLAFFRALPDAFRNNGVEGGLKQIFEVYLPENKLNDAEKLKKEAILDLGRECQADIQAFLEKMILNPYTDVGRLRTEGVHLLTFHAAKGLEFPVVFIIGAEEGITPLHREGTDLEEERRLFYVALTRAKEALQICYVASRSQYGQIKPMEPSRFLEEMPIRLLEKVKAGDKRTNKDSQLRLLY